jgi:hypothetical protein
VEAAAGGQPLAGTGAAALTARELRDRSPLIRSLLRARRSYAPAAAAAEAM